LKFFIDTVFPELVEKVLIGTALTASGPRDLLHGKIHTILINPRKVIVNFRKNREKN
jgi:hypothetical protein